MAARFYRTILALAAILTLAFASPGLAQATPRAAPRSSVEVAPLPPLETGAKPAAPFSADRAIEAYLATVNGEARAKSDAYFEGGYVLQVVDALYVVAVSALLLWSRFSATMRNWSARVTRSRFWQATVYAALYVVATTVLTFPLTVYEGFIREHAYGLSNQTFLAWFGEFGISTALEIAITAIVLTVLYAVVRRAPTMWWAWATLVTTVFLVIGIALAPVFIAPLFNTYKPMAPSPLRNDVLSLARANGIDAKDVYVFDASRQSKRISANVSGILGTTRISLNDNLLNRTSRGETLAVLGHEMGHDVLDHATRLIILNSLVFLLGFLVLNFAFRPLVALFGGNWDVRSIDDPAGLPVLAAIFAIFSLVTTPVTNTITRTTEAQADIFGLNASRQPDGFATATLKLSEYRKLDPSPLEEFLFYDHPSGRSRITMAMRWKAEHLNDPDIKAGPVSPQ